MKYALGNMLNGAGGLNADGLSLDLQFATDKTLTARKGPTPAFTRGSSGTFVGSNGLIQSAGIDVARFDHNPVSLACKGLLIEESRANLVNYSEDFTMVNWVKTNVTVAANNDISPRGDTTADSVLETVANAGHDIKLSPALSAGSYTLSVYVKSIGGRNLNLEVSTGFGGVYANFDLTTGVIITSGQYGSGFTFLGASITSSGNGWYRVYIAVTAPISSVFGLTILTPPSNIIYAGDVTKGVQLWGAQLEAGAFPTSYIPTTTASVVRSVDVCSITGSAFTGMYNQNEGSFACNYSILAGFTGNRYAASIEDTAGGTQNGFVFRNTNSASSFIAGGGYISTIGSTTTVVAKHILAYTGLTEFVYVKDSVIGTTTGSGTRNPSLPISMSIGSLEGSFIVCGHIAAVRYYKKRLVNAKLQALTT